MALFASILNQSAVVFLSVTSALMFSTGHPVGGVINGCLAGINVVFAVALQSGSH